jgi:AcrR family transcriptional regulator
MGVYRRQASRGSGVDHPTRMRIIAVVAGIIKKKGVGALHIDDVLEATGLTRGAVYHHFENVDDLREHALLAIYSEGVATNIDFIRNVVSTSKSFNEFRAGVLEANVLYSENRRLREVRKLRAHALAVATPNGRLAEGLEVEQRRLTDEYVAVITEAKAKGWVRKDVDPRALAVFIQAYSFGVIVDDAAGDHIDAASWRHIIEEFFENCVFEVDPA